MNMMENGQQQYSNNPPLSQPLYGASFEQAVSRFFKKYARFSGYASRSEYWWASLFMGLVLLIPSIMVIIGTGMQPMEGNMYGPSDEIQSSPVGSLLITVGVLLFLGILLITLVPSLALSWRRLHDAGFSGLLYFVTLIPSVGGIILLIFMLLPSKPSARKPEWDDRKGD